MHCNKLKAGNQGSVFLKALPKHLLQVHIRKEGIKLKHSGDKEDLTYSILCHQMDMLRQQLKTAEDEVRSLMKGNHPSGREATALSPTRSTETPHASTQQESLGGMLVGSPRDIVTTELIHQRVVVEVTRPPTRDVGTQTFESQLCSSMPNMKLVGQTASPMGSKAELYVEKSFDPSTIPTLKDIDHEEDIKKLSVRQLKTILVRNYVDIKGCVERKELVERLQRLWESRKMEQERLAMVAGTMAQDDYVCKVCMDAPVDCVFLECGHMVTCVACGKQMNECPICRQYVIRVVHTFRV
jgi:hypothetical protein